MPSTDIYSLAENCIARLHRSGWSCGEARCADSTGGRVYLVDGRNGENRICVEGSSPAEAWRRAVEAAAACGMLADWPRPALSLGRAGAGAGGSISRRPGWRG